MVLYASKVARLTGSSVKAIRLYEERGLLPPVGRDHNGWRIYTGEHLLRIGTIRLLQQSGLSLAHIAKSLDPQHGQTNWDAAEQALEDRVRQAQYKLVKLRQLRESMHGHSSISVTSPEVKKLIDALVSRGYPQVMAHRDAKVGQLLQILLAPEAWDEVIADMYAEVERLDSHKLALAWAFTELENEDEDSPLVIEWVEKVMAYFRTVQSPKQFDYEAWGLDRDIDHVLDSLWQSGLSPAQIQANQILRQRFEAMTNYRDDPS